MPLKITYNNTNSYDDSKSREALQRLCADKQWECKLGTATAPIDAYIFTNKYWVAAELACNSCWTTQSEYPEDVVHIPARKIKHFIACLTHTQPQGSKVAGAQKGYYILFNIEHTIAAIIRFEDILKCTENPKEIVLNGEQCSVVFVPKTYIKKYISIPQ